MDPGSPGVTHCAQGHRAIEAEPKLGPGSSFSATCPPRRSLLLSKCSVTPEFVFPWVQMKVEGSVEWC